MSRSELEIGDLVILVPIIIKLKSEVAVFLDELFRPGFFGKKVEDRKRVDSKNVGSNPVGSIPLRFFLIRSVEIQILQILQNSKNR